MNEQLYIMGLGLSLEEKIEKAIATLRHYEQEAMKFSPNGYYLCDSFGKDSCVILDLAKRSGVKFTAHHSLTTLDPPELVLFGRRNHPDTIISKPAMHMLRYMVESGKGPPIRIKRWCCQIYKETGGYGRVKIFGIRAQESARRRHRWRVWTPRHEGDGWAVNPILYWSEENVWDYLRGNGIPYCKLYDEGFKRVGCIGCPMSSKRREEFARFPRYEAAWKRAFKRYYDKWKGVPRKRGGLRWMDDKKNGINSWEDLWDWWINDDKKEDDDDCQMGLF